MLLLVLIGGFVPFAQSQSVQPYPPLYLDWQSSFPDSLQRVSFCSFKGTDSLVQHQLELLQDASGKSLLFYADILTPVCIDSVCKPLRIALYWNLIGRYVGYGLVPGEPLTKYDHDLFTVADQRKLHQLLLDPHSVLRHKALSDLYDAKAAPAKPIEFNGIELDAVSGATKREIKDAVVEGALYSCYTLWHLVYGPVRQQMEQRIDSVFNAEWLHNFLYSAEPDYQFYAIKRLTGDDFARYHARLAEIFTTASPLVRTYLLKKWPAESWAQARISQAFYELFGEVDINTRTMMIRKLHEAHGIATELLAEYLAEMSRNQLKLYLSYLAQHPEVVTETVSAGLSAAAQGDSSYAYLVEEYMQKYR